MAESEKGEKTEDATPQRREDFRKRGQVAQTRELASAVMLFAILVVLWMLGKFYLQQLHAIFSQSFGSFLVQAAREGEWVMAAKFAASRVFIMITPVFIILWLISFASGVVQVGFLYNEEALQFKPERLNPVKGLKRIFSLKALVEGIKAIFKVTVVATIAALVIRSEIVTVPTLITYSVSQMFVYLGDIVLKLLAGAGFFMIVLAGLDYFFQRWDMEKEMMMSKQEVKEELKSREGDPLIKARIKRVQREMSQKRMMDAVPTADVIVTNPTHIAVALKYSETMVAPQIVAMGADLIAEKIKEMARQHHVPIVENKPLARAMYKTLKIGQTIPRELYQAVAEVLSYVYRLKKKVAR